MPQLCFNLHPKWQRTISALLTCHAILNWANVTTSRRKGRPCSSLFGANWSHALPCMTFFRPFSSSDQVNELFESVCTQALCFWNKEQDLSPEAAPPSWSRKPFSLQWEEAGWLCMGTWCDTRWAEFWDIAQDLICADQNRIEHWLSVSHRAAQCLVQRCGTDPVMWFSVRGSKRLPWGSLDCSLTFSAGNACSGCLKSHSSLLPGSSPHPEQFVLTGIRQKSQKHQNL